MQNITAMIEKLLNDDNRAVKTFKSPQFANSKGQKLAEECLAHFDVTVPMRYIVVYLPNRKRFTTIFLLTEFLRRNNTGGYVGAISDAGYVGI